MSLDQIFDVDAPLFMAVRRAVGDELGRIALTGVLIEPIPEGGAWLVATDGITMLVGKDQTAVAPYPAVVDLRLLKASPDCDDDTRDGPARDWEGLRLRFAVTEEGSVATAKSATTYRWQEPVGVVSDLCPVERFVPWRQVWADPQSLVGRADPILARKSDSFGYRCDMIAKMAGDLGFRLITEVEGGPSVALFDNMPNLVGLIAPIVFRSAGLALATELRTGAVAPGEQAGASDA
ncbi:MAG: hypothetical protein LCH92_01445 [Proteobacteria bacterium]|nr:hypothetical protein [Pseudomonadota bacterium]